MHLALYRYLMIAVLARLADEGARVALILLALEVTGSEAFGGGLVAALMVPHVLAAPAVGAIADRVRHRKPLYATFLVTFGTAIALCGLLTGRAPGAAVLAVAVVGGCFSPLATGGLSSLLRDLVAADQRQRAYGMDVMSYNVAGICGPAAVAVLATGVGPVPATLAVAGSAVASGLLLLTLALPAREPVAGGLNASAVAAGIVVIWRERTLRAVTAASSLGALSIGALPVVSALLAVEYHAGYAAGALLSAAAVGGLLGSLAYARYPIGARRPERVVVGCLLAGAVPLALVPVAPGVGVGMVLFAVAGFFTGPQSAALFLSRDQHTPTEVHTQVFTLGAAMKISAGAVGAALGGLGAGHGPAALVIALAGSQAAAAAIGALILRSREPAPVSTGVLSGGPGPG